MKTRQPKGPVFGMAWYSHQKDTLVSNIRHWCNQGLFILIDFVGAGSVFGIKQLAVYIS